MLPLWGIIRACIALGKIIIRSYARRRLPSSEEKWRSVLLMRSVAERCAPFAMQRIIEKSTTVSRQWTTQDSRASRSMLLAQGLEASRSRASRRI